METYLLPINGVIGEDFKYTDLLLHLNAAKGKQSIKLIINSPGGYVDEGLKIRDAILNTGKLIIAENSGDIASIAVSIFLTAQKGNRYFNPEKGVFLIHNPFVEANEIDPAITLDSTTLGTISKELGKTENDLANDYLIATGTDLEIIKEFMKVNEPLKPEQIEALGFATIKKQEFKAVAYFKHNSEKMENKEVIEKLSGLEKALNKLASLFVKQKNIMLQDVNGVELEFPEAETPEQILVGTKVNAGGTPASGEYVLQDGKTLKCEGGVVTEIVEPASMELESLKKENEELKSQLETAKNDLSSFQNQTETEIKELSQQIAQFKNLVSKTETFKNTPPTEKTNERKPFKI